jgi:hypothetical protein
MSNTWPVIVAALGSAFLASLGSLGVTEWAHRRQADRDAAAAQARACSLLLSNSLNLALKFRALIDTMRFRSGLAEGLSVALHIRRPLDPMTLHDWIAQDWAPFLTALSDTWTGASPEVVTSANRLVAACNELGEALTMEAPTRAGARARGAVFGPDMTAALAKWEAGLRHLGDARHDFALVVRREANLPDVELRLSRTSPAAL